MDMVGSAMNCGHDGSMSTIHANNATDVLSRLENMFLMAADIPISAIRKQIASGIDLIIQLGRLRDKSRKVLEISEVIGIEKEEVILNRLYLFQERENKGGNQVEGCLVQVGKLVNTYKMEIAGIREI